MMHKCLVLVQTPINRTILSWRNCLHVRYQRLTIDKRRETFKRSGNNVLEYTNLMFDLHEILSIKIINTNFANGDRILYTDSCHPPRSHGQIDRATRFTFQTTA